MASNRPVEYIDTGPNARLWITDSDGNEQELAVVVASNGYLRAVKPPEPDLGIDQDDYGKVVLRNAFGVDQS